MMNGTSLILSPAASEAIEALRAMPVIATAPTPWRGGTTGEEQGLIFDANGMTVGMTFSHGMSDPYARRMAQQIVNLRRIVACVNACAGIDTEMLERTRVVALTPLDGSEEQ